VRTGYLDALAARTLGAAPLLRPVTPSRFEPNGPTGHLEVLEMVEPATDVPALRPEPHAHPPSPPQPPQTAVEKPLLPPVEPDPAMPVLAPVAATDPPVVQGGPAADVETAPLAVVALARTVNAAPAGPAPTVRAADALLVDTTPTGPHRASPHRRAAEPLRTPDEPAPPAVVVRIGRIEVRAESAPRPFTVPRPPPVPAGRSLADHLHARDQELS
jgi:hypothetical protein